MRSSLFILVKHSFRDKNMFVLCLDLNKCDDGVGSKWCVDFRISGLRSMKKIMSQLFRKTKRRLRFEIISDKTFPLMLTFRLLPLLECIRPPYCKSFTNIFIALLDYIRVFSNPDNWQTAAIGIIS